MSFRDRDFPDRVSPKDVKALYGNSVLHVMISALKGKAEQAHEEIPDKVGVRGLLGLGLIMSGVPYMVHRAVNEGQFSFIGATEVATGTTLLIKGIRGRQRLQQELPH